MIEARRVLEMGNKVHWYICFILLGLVAFYEGSLLFEVSDSYVAFLNITVLTSIFIALVFGIWLFTYCFYLFFKSKVFSFRPFFANLVRILMIIVLDIIFSLSYNIAGNSILII